MSFSQFNLHPDISKAIDHCGYKQPTPIQERSIHPILSGKDLIASAQTGTGKTAAFVLPALQKISLSKPNSKPRVLILTPTRELASQITDAASKYGKFLRFKIISLVGGMSYRQQLRNLSQPVDIIVATPGRLLDHMRNRRVNFGSLEMLILDEADRMLDMGFIDDVKEIAKATSSKRQTLLFSATFDNRLAKEVSHLLKDPTRIDIQQEKISPTKIKQELYYVDNFQHKNNLLQHFLENESIFKAIIFSATKVNADALAKQLRQQGIAADALHGDLKQAVRNKIIENLRKGKIQFLVATDVAARGLDINDVTHVFNYDLPKFSEDYIHRIGRTGRAGKSGVAISFASPADQRNLQKIERFIKQKLQVLTVPGLEAKKQHQGHGHHQQRPNNNKHKKHGKSFRNSSDRHSSDRHFFGRDDKHKSGRHFSDRDDRNKSDRHFSNRDDRNKAERKFSHREDRKKEDRYFSNREDRNKSDRHFSNKDDRSKKGRHFSNHHVNSRDKDTFDPDKKRKFYRNEDLFQVEKSFKKSDNRHSHYYSHSTGDTTMPRGRGPHGPKKFRKGKKR